MTGSRVNILDGFRVIAIFVVMLYHFYSSFPHHYQYNFDTSIFRFGYLGVEFFFMISGFVIFISLENSKNFLEFIKKRYLRLMPGMLICSILTFLVYNSFDFNFYPPAKEFKNLLFSNTFISPSLPNKLLNTNFDYIDSSYWSLWVEVIFYTIISILYFANKRYVIINYSIIAISSLVLKYLYGSSNLLGLPFYEIISKFLSYIPFINLLIWFLVGIIISKLYLDKKNYAYLFYLIFLFTLIFITTEEIEIKYFIIIVSFLWYLFLYKTKYLNFLGSNLFSSLGKSSYSVYLIHQMIGVALIIEFSPYFNQNNWVIAIVLIPLFFVFGLFSYRYLEMPIGNRLKKILFK